MVAGTWSALFITLSLGLACNAAIGPVGELIIANKIASPDGFSRSAVLANGKVWGPLIRGKKGDNFRLNVVDRLNDTTMDVDTTIHWHGLFQRGSNWADGPAMVNQCPIVPGHSFLYDFNVPDQAGTFWYHSHLAAQYCDGLRGPLVVYDPHDPHRSMYDIDDESTVLAIGDWYHESSLLVTGAAHPDSTLFNGLGRSLSGPQTPLYVLNVVYGKKYRIRLVNIACDPNYIFSIDGHTMTIIETDAVNTQPLAVESLQIFVGQRYSFVLHANQTIGNYWIRANPNSGNIGFNNSMNSAILRYRGAPLTDPITNETATDLEPFSETNLHPLMRNPKAPGKPYPGGADVNINLQFNYNISGGVFTVNGVTFQPPPVPVLLQILSGAHTVHDLIPAGSIYTLPRNKVVEVTLPALALAGPHAIHLHGHTFSVVRSAGSATYNYDNPIRRDVVSIGTASTDNVTIRFVTDNAGPWFLHCHIDWHLNVGFAAVFAEDPQHANRPNNLKNRKAWSELCPLYNKSNHRKLTMGTNPHHRPPKAISHGSRRPIWQKPHHKKTHHENTHHEKIHHEKTHHEKASTEEEEEERLEEEEDRREREEERLEAMRRHGSKGYKSYYGS